MTYDFVSCDYLLEMEPFLTDATEPNFRWHLKTNQGTSVFLRLFFQSCRQHAEQKKKQNEYF